MLKRFMILSGLVLTVAFGAAGSDEETQPLDIGSRLELFVDDFLIDQIRGLELQLHPPETAGRVFSFDQPWEGNTSFYATIFQDGDRYRMYYRGSSEPSASPPWAIEGDVNVVPKHPEFACYAETHDGINWKRPSLGIFEFEGSKDNNIVWKGKGSHNFAPFRDANPEAPPSERYKALAGGPLIALKSSDALHWEKIQEEPVISDGAFDSLNLPLWDAARSRYVAFYRDFTNGVRHIKFASSQDFLTWTTGQWFDFGDAPAEHLYTNGTIAYPRAPHLFLGFPKRFHPWRNLLEDAPRPGLSDGVFMSSRDGLHWDRRFMEAFIRPGRDPRNWLNRNNYPIPGLVATAPDELSLYVIRNYKFPSVHIERMVLRTDGFASVHAGYAGGEFLTRPLIFQGGNLILNFSTSAAGSIRLEIQDTQGNPLPGFSIEESPLVWGDEIEHTVRWVRSHAKANSDSPLARLAGKPVRLRFVMSDADLYSLRFQ